jgi:hypothetical protein
MGEVIDQVFRGTSDEDAALRQAAGHAGWRVDDDDWFWRWMRPGDPDLETVVRDDPAGIEIGFCCAGKVYVPDCECALAYDRGETKIPKVLP